MNQGQVFLGVLKYECVMQLRRRAVWVTFLFCALVLAGLAFGYRSGGWPDLLHFPLTTPLVTIISRWTMIISYSFPLIVGLLLADRLRRDQRIQVNELLGTLPSSLCARLWGKYLGNMCALLLPVFLCYAAGIGCVLVHAHSLLVIPLALETFAVTVLPGIAFVSACSLAFPALLPVPFYQFLFIGYWFWGNLLPPDAGIPTLSGTILTPSGATAFTGFFGGRSTVAGATVLQAEASILLLLAFSGLILILLCRYLVWQQARH